MIWSSLEKIVLRCLSLPVALLVQHLDFGADQGCAGKES